MPGVSVDEMVCGDVADECLYLSRQSRPIFELNSFMVIGMVQLTYHLVLNEQELQCSPSDTYKSSVSAENFVCIMIAEGVTVFS